MRDLYIRHNVWQYEEGFKIGDGDFIDFESGFYEIKKNIIFRKKKPVAEVVKLNLKLNEITVKSISSGSIGIYINVNEFTE